MKKLFFTTCLLVFISMILVISSCSKQEFTEEDALITNGDKLSQANSRDGDGSVYEVEYILEYLKANSPIDWTTERDAKLLHSIGFYTDFSYIIGYKPKEFTDFENGFTLEELSKPSWKTAKESILSQFNFYEEDILQEAGDDIFPAILVKASSPETMERLVGMDELYAIEPQVGIFLLKFDEQIQFENPVVSGSGNRAGCNCDQPSEPENADFKPIEPGMKMSWTYPFSGITEYAIGEQPDPNITHAWEISTGQNVGVAVIDSGVSYDQENLDNFGAFSMIGSSFGRYEERRDFLGVELGIEQVGLTINGVPLFVTVEKPIQDGREAHDRCGHGTRMAGIIAGPRGVDGNSVGIAYNCDLYNYRAVHNPIILTNREIVAVSQALMAAAMDDNIKIINMSIAQPFQTLRSIFIQLGIDMAYDEDKMMVCAAGTSTSTTSNLGVLFPASSNKTIAIAGIKVPVNYPDDGEFESCTNCHSGDEINYSIIFEDRENPSREALAITCSGDVPSFSGGTSTAAATFSGIAALVWSKLMSETLPGDPPILPSDVLTQISLSANNPLGITAFGEGYINALEALEN